MEFNLKPKMLVNGALILTAAYLFMEWWPTDNNEGVSKLLPLAALGIAFYIVNDKLVDKAEATKKEVPSLGPEEPFMPNQGPQFDLGPDGKPVLKNYPPRKK